MNHGRTRLRFPERGEGIILVLVLWMLALLSLMAAGFASATRTEVAVSAFYVQAAQARAYAEAGVWLAISDLTLPALERRWDSRGTALTIQFDEGTIVVGVQDETGKIDLNSGSPELLASLLLSTGLATDDAERIRDAILDWRDRDNLRRTSGAEDDDYVAEGFAYEAKDGPFNAVDELRLVAGMTNRLFERIAPALTVHSHQPGLNFDVAVPEALIALPGAEEAEVTRYLAARGESGASMSGVQSRYMSRGAGRIFMITSHGRKADGVVRVDAVVRIHREGERPYSILSWSDGNPATRAGEQVVRIDQQYAEASGLLD